MAFKQVNESVEIDRTGGKLCFVTIGATAGFDSLIRAVLDKTFIRALEGDGYTDLVIQYGKDEGAVYNKFQEETLNTRRTASGLRITGFGFKKVGLDQEMRAVKGGKDGKEGVVISHAGKNYIRRSA